MTSQSTWSYLEVIGSGEDGQVVVLEHAMGGRHHVLRGHQGPATELSSTIAGDHSHHPGILVGRRHLGPTYYPRALLYPTLTG